MALKIPIETSSGVTAVYWHIVAVYVHRTEKYVEIQFDGWLDEPKRRLTKDDGTPRYRPLDRAVTKLGPEGYTAVTKSSLVPSYADLYTYLLTLPAWKDAESV